LKYIVYKKSFDYGFCYIGCGEKGCNNVCVNNCTQVCIHDCSIVNGQKTQN
jgi:hypothetical protein